MNRLKNSAAAVALLLSPDLAAGQGLGAIPGVSLGGTLDGSVDKTRHRGPLGKPCLTFVGMARPHIIDPKLFDHVMTVDNSCGQRLKVRVCYSQTDRCIDMDVPGYGRKEAILGIMPSEPVFRFDFKEQF